MKYLCLGYLDREAVDALPKTELDRIMGQCPPHMEALYATGHLRVDMGLANETKGLRRRKGKVVVTDGPFTETKELLGGVFLIDAESWDEAVELAKLHPTTQIAEGEALGWRLEVRPLHYFKQL